MSVIEPPDFEWFRKLFLLRYKAAQESTLITPWYSLRALLEVYDALLPLKDCGVVERALVHSWINRINRRISYLNAIDKRTNRCGLLCS